MINEFIKEFGEYTTVELLEIIEQAEDYQPKSVEAAKNILSQRTVSAEELDEAKQELAEKAIKKNNQKEKINSKVDQVVETLSPAVIPSETFDVRKWIYLLCFLLAIQYTWIAFGTVKQLIDFFHCETCHLGSQELFEFLTLIFAPAIIYLLLSRDKWGWILTMGSSIFIALSHVLVAYILIKYPGIRNDDPSTRIVQSAVNTVFAFFLIKRNVRNEFAISSSTARMVAAFTIIGTLSYYALIFLMSN